MSPIEPAALDDLPLLAQWMEEFYVEAGYAFDARRARQALSQLLGDPGLGRVWRIVSDDESVGYVAIAFGFSLEYHGRDAFVDELFIRPLFRGVGLGGRVLEAVESACRELGVRALHLEVERANAAGRALYRRWGFEGNDRQLLSKRLS